MRQSEADAIEHAVEAHILHLLRFAAPERFLLAGDQAAPASEHSGIYRKWTYWEDLDGAIHPARRDGSGTVAIWRRMLEWAGKGGENRMSSVNGMNGADRPNDGVPVNLQDARNAGEATLANEAEMQWLVERGLLQQPVPAPGRAVTWSELAGLLRRWEEAAKEPEKP